MMSESITERPELVLIHGEAMGPSHKVDPNWRQMGHCAQPGIRASDMAPAADNTEGIEWAKRICMGCIATKRCLEYGLRMSEQIDFGIWGGTTPAERVVIRARRCK